MRKKLLGIIILISILCGVFALNYGFAAQTKEPRTAVNTVENNVQEIQQNTETTAQSTNAIKTQTLAGNEEVTRGLSNHDIGLLAAALATGLACIGAGIAVAVVASSAVGAISENPSLLGKTIIFAGLAEGIAIYGLIISIMILNKI